MLVQPSVYLAFKPLLVVARFVGLNPYTRHRYLTKALLGFSGIILVVFTGLAGLAIKNLALEDPEWYSSAYYLSLDRCQILLTCMSLNSAVWTGLLNSSSLSAILHELHNCDRLLAKLGFLFTYNMRQSFTMFILQMSAMTTLCVSDVLFYTKAYNSWYAVNDMVVMYGPLYIVYTCNALFYSLVLILTQHFKFLNEKLTVLGSSAEYQGKILKMEELLQVFHHLVHVSTMVNKVFSLNLLIGVFKVFVMTTVNLYVGVTVALSPSSDYNGLAYFLVVAALVILRMWELWTIVAPCVQASKTAEEFSAILYGVMLHDKTDKISGNEMFKVFISTKRAVSFSAQGFFILDYELVQSMAGGAATFLVILVQFFMANNSKQGATSATPATFVSTQFASTSS